MASSFAFVFVTHDRPQIPVQKFKTLLLDPEGHKSISCHLTSSSTTPHTMSSMQSLLELMETCRRFHTLCEPVLYGEMRYCNFSEYFCGTGTWGRGEEGYGKGRENGWYYDQEERLNPLTESRIVLMCHTLLQRAEVGELVKRTNIFVDILYKTSLAVRLAAERIFRDEDLESVERHMVRLNRRQLRFDDGNG